MCAYVTKLYVYYIYCYFFSNKDYILKFGGCHCKGFILEWSKYLTDWFMVTKEFADKHIAKLQSKLFPFTHFYPLCVH